MSVYLKGIIYLAEAEGASCHRLQDHDEDRPEEEASYVHHADHDDQGRVPWDAYGAGRDDQTD